MSNTCEICGTVPAQQLPPIGGMENQSVGRDCPRCGKFWLMGPAIQALPNLIGTRAINRSVLSHRLRLRFDAANKPILLYEPDLQLYVGDTRLPKPQEQADNFILWIGNAQETPEEWAQATVQHLAAIIGVAKTGNQSGEPGFDWLHQQINESRLYMQTNTPDGSQIKLRLTMKGWKEFDVLSKRVTDSRTAFMAMKFGDPMLNKVVAECFKPAVLRAGFTLRPLNEGQGAGLIDNQIRAAIRSARFVVADLTHDNNGAYFEAGFAEGIGVPVIYTCEAKRFAAKKTHFDTNHLVTIPWSIDKLDETAKRLIGTVINTLPGEATLSDD